MWYLPIIVGLGRAFRSILSKIAGGEDLQFSWTRFIGSLLIALAAGTLVMTGIGVNSTVTLLVSAAGTWLSTDYIEDIVRAIFGE